MRDRDPRGGGDGGDRGDPGHDFGLDPGLAQGKRLLAAAPEDERVAALQANDVEARAAVADEQLVQRLLVDPVTGDHPAWCGASSTSS